MRQPPQPQLRPRPLAPCRHAAAAQQAAPGTCSSSAAVAAVHGHRTVSIAKHTRFSTGQTLVGQQSHLLNLRFSVLDRTMRPYAPLIWRLKDRQLRVAEELLPSAARLPRKQGCRLSKERALGCTHGAPARAALPPPQSRWGGACVCQSYMQLLLRQSVVTFGRIR